MNKRKRSGIYYQVQDLKPTGDFEMSKADQEICKILDQAWDESREAIIECNNSVLEMKARMFDAKEAKTTKNYLKLTDFD